MKLISTLIKYSLGLSLAFGMACSTPATTSGELGVDTSTLQIGTEQNGAFVAKADKTFTAADKIILKAKAKGLTVKEGKVKMNIDLFLKKDKDVLGTENDILGKDGLIQTIPGVDATFSGTNGEADLQIGILPPSNTTGELTANVTLKDLNTSGKVVSFETKFTLK